MSPPEIGALPPGLGRKRPADERIDWILASIYCTCSNGGDVCTGQVYTLSLCDPKACPMPRATRAKLAAWIAGGLTDDAILKRIEQEQGPRCRRLHLIR
jgi:hypothetical protein